MDNKENWLNIIKSWQNSGEKQTTWCKQNNVNIATFKYWKQKFKKANNPDVKFHELESKAQIKKTIPESKPITIEIANVKINVPDGSNPHLLKIIIQVLKSC